MSRAMSATELVIMVSVISASLVVMIALVFVAERQSNDQRPHSSGQPAIRLPVGDHGSGPAHEPSRLGSGEAGTPASSTTAVAGPVLVGRTTSQAGPVPQVAANSARRPAALGGSVLPPPNIPSTRAALRLHACATQARYNNRTIRRGVRVM